jgi:hypothetical protein
LIANAGDPKLPSFTRPSQPTPFFAAVSMRMVTELILAKLKAPTPCFLRLRNALFLRVFLARI